MTTMMMISHGTWLAAFSFLLWAPTAVVVAAIEYGVDVSFPMHHANVSHDIPVTDSSSECISDAEQQECTIANDASFSSPNNNNTIHQPLGDRQAFFDNYMQGCYSKDGAKRCDPYEADRIDMTLRQPSGMRNYTKMGFTKIRAPQKVMDLLNQFWKANQDQATLEHWPKGSIYTNHWEAPAKMVNVEDTTLDGGGPSLKQHIWNAARTTIQEWTGQRLVECSLYGIRIYPEGAVLAPHVDRLPLVSSAIINVDQDVDEPWPLEVIGHDGRAHNVTMEPGDLVLYESHSIIHGRPFPLKGRYMANVFIHFEPIGSIDGETEYTGDLPPYVTEGGSWEKSWRATHPNGHKLFGDEDGEEDENGHQRATEGATDAHRYAGLADIVNLKKTLERDGTLINKRDSNGWQPIHEAVRTGDPETIAVLLTNGADASARVGRRQEGASPLYLLEYFHKEDQTEEFYDDVETLLKEYNGIRYEPFQGM